MGPDFLREPWSGGCHAGIPRLGRLCTFPSLWRRVPDSLCPGWLFPNLEASRAPALSRSNSLDSPGKHSLGCGVAFFLSCSLFKTIVLVWAQSNLYSLWFKSKLQPTTAVSFLFQQWGATPLASCPNPELHLCGGADVEVRLGLPPVGGRACCPRWRRGRLTLCAPKRPWPAELPLPGRQTLSL